jgi:hypothetical protein
LFGHGSCYQKKQNWLLNRLLLQRVDFSPCYSQLYKLFSLVHCGRLWSCTTKVRLFPPQNKLKAPSQVRTNQGVSFPLYNRCLIRA